MVEELLKLATVLMIGMLGIWKSIPVGFILKVHPLWIASLSAAGSILTVSLIFFSGEKVKERILKFYKKENLERRKSRIRNLVKKYGLPGLGIATPGFIGPIMTILLGILFFKPKISFLFYTWLGIVLWSFLITTLAQLGILVFS